MTPRSIYTLFFFTSVSCLFVHREVTYDSIQGITTCNDAAGSSSPANQVCRCNGNTNTFFYKNNQNCFSTFNINRLAGNCHEGFVVIDGKSMRNLNICMVKDITAIEVWDMRSGRGEWMADWNGQLRKYINKNNGYRGLKVDTSYGNWEGLLIRVKLNCHFRPSEVKCLVIKLTGTRKHPLGKDILQISTDQSIDIRTKPWRTAPPPPTTTITNTTKTTTNNRECGISHNIIATAVAVPTLFILTLVVLFIFLQKRKLTEKAQHEIQCEDPQINIIRSTTLATMPKVEDEDIISL